VVHQNRDGDEYAEDQATQQEDCGQHCDSSREVLLGEYLARNIL
jgi:hypothetical protein